MFSILKIIRSGIGYLWANSIQKSNLVVFPDQQLKIQYFTTFKKILTSPNLKLLTQYRCLGTIIIKQTENRFFININDQVAHLKYSISNGVMEIRHTKVPKELGGRGLGKLLAKVALEYAVQHDLLLKIKCNFVQNYINEYEPRFKIYVLR